MVIGSVAASVLALGVGIKYGRHHVFAKRFEVVEPGRIYRSGRLERGPLRRVIRRHELETILTLLGDEPESPSQQMENEMARAEGVDVIRIGMPGDGLAEHDRLDRAADVLADPARRPVLVHCAAGVHRTGATLAAWRMKHQGWSFERALEELAAHGYDAADDPRLRDHLRAYYETYVAGQATRPAGIESDARETDPQDATTRPR